LRHFYKPRWMPKIESLLRERFIIFSIVKLYLCYNDLYHEQGTPPFDNLRFWDSCRLSMFKRLYQKLKNDLWSEKKPWTIADRKLKHLLQASLKEKPSSEGLLIFKGLSLNLRVRGDKNGIALQNSNWMPIAFQLIPKHISVIKPFSFPVSRDVSIGWKLS
jgi:hypothetical protein